MLGVVDYKGIIYLIRNDELVYKRSLTEHSYQSVQY